MTRSQIAALEKGLTDLRTLSYKTDGGVSFNNFADNMTMGMVKTNFSRLFDSQLSFPV
jgi:hypothetical protein